MRLFSISRLAASIAGLATAFAALAVALAEPIFSMLREAFPADTPAMDRSADAPSTEIAERMSQTGKGVWAFVTDLFKVEGRTYLWQGGDVA